jgi:3-hydroxyacyl-[acyl-carrier-protein] dehydratase
MNSMDINEVLQHLPHRYPFLLIDRVINIEPGKSLTALKNVTINEPFFMGHFPQQPVMPGVLILEALAQAACVLAFKTNGGDPKAHEFYLFAAIDKARFRRPVIPGDQLQLQVDVLRVRQSVLKVQGTASVDGKEVCSAELMSVKGSTSDS